MNTLTPPAWAHPHTDLTGRTALVVGGAGGVGEGVVRALLDAGARVVAAGRSSTRLDELASRLRSPRLRTTLLDALAEDLDRAVSALAAEHGGFDAVVVSVASWGDQGRKPLLALTDAEWDGLVAANQTSVFRLYRALVPQIATGGVLVQLNGLSADLPFPGAGGVALTAAATKSLTRTLAAELDGHGPRVHEVILGVVRTRARQLAGVDDPRWIEGTEVGIHLAELIAGTSPLTGAALHYFVDKAAGPSGSAPERP
ncbi:SDR family oxidoreductase [Arthrobacter zhaoguopingii]|uniref:SDR family oxidoreductase n=1 Tax=Arthrobacter zhaoguopingii TaxID=2681491 RepID=UPI001358C8B4|nr:SDR family oxidoreductase [Arthrobacter zhaoguopingii]